MSRLLLSFLDWRNGPGTPEVVPIPCSIAGHQWSGGATTLSRGLTDDGDDDRYWRCWYQCRRCGAVTREHHPDDFLSVHHDVTKRHLEKTEMG